MLNSCFPNRLKAELHTSEMAGGIFFAVRGLTADVRPLAQAREGLSESGAKLLLEKINV
jgi:hypothetical protein